MNVMKHKGYEGTAEIDTELNICRGEVLFIQDVVTYSATSPAELKERFMEAVEDYLETCTDLGREPQKPLKGQFNVRIAPALHKELVLESIKENTSLNDIVSRACNAYVHPPFAKGDMFVSLSLYHSTEERVVTSTSGGLEWLRPEQQDAY